MRNIYKKKLNREKTTTGPEAELTSHEGDYPRVGGFVDTVLGRAGREGRTATW